jgi:hypothetical protein
MIEEEMIALNLEGKGAAVTAMIEMLAELHRDGRRCRFSKALKGVPLQDLETRSRGGVKDGARVGYSSGRRKWTAHIELGIGAHIMSARRKTKQKVRKDLHLDSEPTDEFMNLAKANAFAGKERRAPSRARATRPADLEGVIQRATAGALLSKAKEQAGRSLSEIGKKTGMTKQRVAQILESENLEVGTMARLAAAMGYELVIALHPVSRDLPDLPDLQAILPGAVTLARR